MEVLDEIEVIETDLDAKDGQNKCPKCGATEISLNINNGNLRCHYCRHEFKSEIVNNEGDIHKLDKTIVGSGATSIIPDTNDILTFKCESCGAEVIIDTNESVNARCHWCRNTLSVNQQIPNGAVPDMILPFKIKKEEAELEINKFVSKRKFFANPVFKKEFTTKNIMGVYLPYMVVDLNTKAEFDGEAEILIRKYTVRQGDHNNTYYDADAYKINRKFDMIIDDLTIESSSDKLKNNKNKTNNIINAIMPFDTENAVKWDANFLKGFTSEKRDTNIEQLQELVNVQAKDVARFNARSTISQYNRGAKWEVEKIEVLGQKWKAAYLPVWLYSYQEVKSEKKKILHYVAVNARTKETIGSVPINFPKLLFFSFLFQLLGIFLTLFFSFDYDFIFLSTGAIYYAVFYFKYRNSDAKHGHHNETKSKINSIVKSDSFLEHRKGLSDSDIRGCNDSKVDYNHSAFDNFINKIK